MASEYVPFMGVPSEYALLNKFVGSTYLILPLSISNFLAISHNISYNHQWIFDNPSMNYSMDKEFLSHFHPEY